MTTPLKAAANRDDGSDEEGITVAIRMRPLNKVEGDKRRVWKVLPKYSSITQTTPAGKALPERITGRTFFTFDKTFGEEASTADVYTTVAKNIVSSVVSGLNGTIFAYGQTSSGKTFTMQGSGSIQEGSMENGGGIVHMAAKDIFSQIQQEPDRIFLVRASFLEIYNEEVRDLLSNSKETLPIREDPRRGVFVQSNEEIVTDFESLLKILFQGEKSRQFAATEMNARSSRSHTIFRITIESRMKTNDDDNEQSDDEWDENKAPNGVDGAVRVSTLNLVDLAGSESVRHTGATGDRQKEGGMINQSLLTLSRVIVALGTPNQMHINFRDSKLTRILQPSLSGNARMAVVCCATPSELYLEETRSTLQFASRAKLVKTNAKVNEVIDDRSMIRKLQRELAEAKKNGGVGVPTEELRELQNKAASAGNAALEAQEKLKRLKASFLNAGRLLESKKEAKESTAIGRRRRKSEGALMLGAAPLTPSAKEYSSNPPTPETHPRPTKKPKVQIRAPLSPSSELYIVREALSSKNIQLQSLKDCLEEQSMLMQNKMSELGEKQAENELLQKEREESMAEFDKASEMVASLQKASEHLKAEHETMLTQKDDAIQNALAKIEEDLQERKELRETIESLQQELETEKKGSSDELSKLQEENEELRRMLESLSQEKDMVVDSVESEMKVLKERFVALQEESDQRGTKLETLQQEMTEMQETHSSEKAEFEENYTALKTELEEVQAENASLLESRATGEAKVGELESYLQQKGSELQELQRLLEESKAAFQKKAFESNLSNTVLMRVEDRLQEREHGYVEMTKAYQTELSDFAKSQAELEYQLGESKTETDRLNQELQDARGAVVTLEKDLEESRREMQELRQSISSYAQRAATLSSEVVQVNSENSSLLSTKTELEGQLREMQQEIHSLQSVHAEKEEMHVRIQELSEENSGLDKSLGDAREELEGLWVQIKELEAKASMVDSLESEKKEIISEAKSETLSVLERLNSSQEKLAELINEKEILLQRTNELEDVVASLETTKGALEEELNSLREEKKSTVDELTSLSKDNWHLMEQVEELESSAVEKEALETELRQYIEETRQELEQVKATLATTKEELTHSEGVISDLVCQRDETAQKYEDLRKSFEDLQGQNISSSEELGALKSDLEEKLEKLQNELTQKTTALQDSTLISEQLQSEKDSLQIEFEGLQAFQVELEKSQQQLEEDLQNFRNANEELITSKANLETSLELAESKLVAAQGEITRLSSSQSEYSAQAEEALRTSQATIEQQIIQINELYTQNDKFKSQVSDLAEDKNDLESRCQLADSMCNSLANEKQSLNSQLSEKNLLVQELEKNLETFRQELAEARDENERIVAADSDLLNKLLESEQQVSALQECNDDLSKKSSELTEAIGVVREDAERLRALCSDLQYQKEEYYVQLTSQSGLEGNLSKAISDLEGQLEEAKQEIEHMTSRSSHIETELELALGAKDMLTQKLEECELARDEAVNKLEEQYQATKRLNKKLLESSSKAELNQLSSELETTKRAYTSLQQRLETLSADRSKALDTSRKLEGDIKSKELQLSEARTRIEKLEQDISELISQERLSQETVASVEGLEAEKKNLVQERDELLCTVESFRRKAAESEKKAQDIEAALYDTQQELKDMSADNSNLKASLKQLEEAKVTQEQIASKSSDDSFNKVLEQKLKEMEASIAEKDSRIEHLEKNKLTKEKLLKIKTSQEERIRFEKKYKEYKTKYQQATTEIESLKRKSSGNNNELETELQSLRFDKEALENKLRKFAKHCQLLEDEKSEVIDLIRSFPGVSLNDGDIHEALVSISDRCTSLEQEIDTLRESASVGPSNTYEVARLEEENLQLHQDLKKMRDDLRQAREEMEQLRVNGGGEPTLDLSLFDQTGEHDSISAGSKTSKSTLRSTPSSKQRTSDVPTSKAGRPPLASITSNKKRKPTPSAEDKENSSNAAFGDVTPSESKRPRTRSSARKAAAAANAAPGLGESVLGHEESTAECKQS